MEKFAMQLLVPAWSPEIANEFIRRAANDGRKFDQMMLQELVYIAHGWCLAIYHEPLTGDRPEARHFGPEYRRLADALARYGIDPVSREIRNDEAATDWPGMSPTAPARADLQPFEQELISRVYQSYGTLDRAQLARLTRKEDGTPWKEVFAGGAGEFRDIPHALIEEQFLAFADLSSGDASH
jgi:uncharacterized phage-associated protein